MERFQQAMQQVSQNNNDDRPQRRHDMARYSKDTTVTFRVIPWVTDDGSLWIDKAYRQVWIAGLSSSAGQPLSKGVPVNFSPDDMEANKDPLYTTVQTIIRYNMDKNPKGADTILLGGHPSYPTRIQERHQIVVQLIVQNQQTGAIAGEVDAQGAPVFRCFDMTQAMYGDLINLIMENKVRKQDGQPFPSPEQGGLGFVDVSESYALELSKPQGQMRYNLTPRGDLRLPALPSNYMDFVDRPSDFIDYTTTSQPDWSADIQKQLDQRYQNAVNGFSNQNGAGMQQAFGQQAQAPYVAPQVNQQNFDSLAQQAPQGFTPQAPQTPQGFVPQAPVQTQQQQQDFVAPTTVIPKQTPTATPTNPNVTQDPFAGNAVQGGVADNQLPFGMNTPAQTPETVAPANPNLTQPAPAPEPAPANTATPNASQPVTPAQQAGGYTQEQINAQLENLNL